MTKETEENPYQQALANLVHFSLKTINSNIKGGGIRLNSEKSLDLPYISTRTLIDQNLTIPADYHTNPVQDAPYVKVAILSQGHRDISEEPDEIKLQIDLLKPYLKTILDHQFSYGLESVNSRMRQLLIPKAQKYISVSPLSAAGVNLLLNIEVDTLREQRKREAKDSKLKNIQTAVFGIGGSKPQNVGSLARAMQRPIVLGSPTLEPQKRLAFQYFYKGFDYQISNAYINQTLYQELTTYAKSLIEQQKLSLEVGFHDYGIQAPFSNMKTRAAELSTIQTVVDDVLQQGQEILQILKSIQDELPSLKALERKSFWSHSGVPLIAQGLINPELQQFEDWQQLFADDLAKKITQHSYWKKEIKNNVSISLSEADAKNFLSRRIQELLA